MAITGSQKAYTYALSNVARSGATRSGYVSAHVYITIGGASFTGSVAYGSLTITDSLDEVPNRCTFRAINAVPTTGQDVIITLGSRNSLERLFAGHVLTVDELIGGKPDQVRSDVSCVDYTWQLGFLKVTKRYANTSASAIAADLIATYAAMNGFHAGGVVAGLPGIDEITFTNEDLPDALTRLARRIGGYWYVDYRKGVHLFLEDTTQAPTPVTAANPTLSLAGFGYDVDRSQALTRVYVEGRGSRLIGAVALGDTMIPLDAVDMFAVSSDVFVKVSFQGSEGGAQHLSYTGVVNQPGVGSLVGPGNGPAGVLTLAPNLGTGLTPGTYQYAYTDVTPSGESLPSPVGSIAVGQLMDPQFGNTVPGLTPEPSTTGPEPGLHDWAFTWVSAGGGETLPTLSGRANTVGPLPATGGIKTVNNWATGPLTKDRYYGYAVTYVGLSGETTAAMGFIVYTALTTATQKFELFIGDQDGSATFAVPAGTTAIKVYRAKSVSAGSSQMGPYLFTGNATVTVMGNGQITGTFMDLTTDAALGAAIPTTNTATRSLRKVRVLIGNSGNAPAGFTARRIYRSTVNTQLPLKLVATINDMTTSEYIDQVPDASLGATAPTTNTAGTEYKNVFVSNLAPGPSPTTGRKIYRTAANGAQLKLAMHLGDNTTTAFNDSLPDASLGVNAPTGDTSALQVPAGSVPAGSPSLIVANGSVFPTGGWAIIGNGEQVIRYTAKSATALTGIPATGIGAMTAAVAYNSTVTIAPMLTGIPATGTRSITRALTAGDEVYLVVQVDDPARQAQLAAVMGGTGIREEWVQDRRLSITEARSRGQATLSVRPLDRATLSYRCFDRLTAAGKSVLVNLTVGAGSPLNVSGTFKIQQVTIDNFRPYPTQPPTYTVEASGIRFSFEDWLRRMQTRT